MVCVMIHSGSRGLGYQVCDDALAAVPQRPGRSTASTCRTASSPAPRSTVPKGSKYIGAMRAAANFAWCNRQLLMQQAREVFADVFGRSWEDLRMNLVYDVAHNIAKLEEHTVDGKTKKVWVHRKGATRAFPAGHPEVPAAYRTIGQPVIIPGDMGRASWVLVGQPGSMEKTFGTTCHGAGRAMSRTAAVQDAAGPAHRQGTGSPRRHRPGPEPQGPRGGAAEGVQERRRRGRRRRTRPGCRTRWRGCGRLG